MNFCRSVEARPTELRRRCRRLPQPRDGYVDPQADTQIEVVKPLEALPKKQAPQPAPAGSSNNSDAHEDDEAKAVARPVGRGCFICRPTQSPADLTVMLFGAAARAASTPLRAVPDGR